MNLRKRHLFLNAVDTATSTAAPSPAPAPAPAAAPTTAPAPAADESLLPPPGTVPAAPAAAPAAEPEASTATEYGWLPDKFRVNGADGKLDLNASSQKLGESYRNLERAKGAGAPSKAEDYAWTPPEELKDLSFDEALHTGFRDRAHKAGLSQEQFAFVMGEYVNLVPELLNGAAEASAAAAREELSKVWSTPSVFEAQVNNAARAIAAGPADLQAELHAKYGRDPAFIRFAAHLGQGMREDRPPSNPDGGTGGGATTVDQLMAHPAYRDPKHPEHKVISQRVMEAHQRANPG